MRTKSVFTILALVAFLHSASAQSYNDCFVEKKFSLEQDIAGVYPIESSIAATWIEKIKKVSRLGQSLINYTWTQNELTYKGPSNKDLIYQVDTVEGEYRFSVIETFYDRGSIGAGSVETTLEFSYDSTYRSYALKGSAYFQEYLGTECSFPYYVVCAELNRDYDFLVSYLSSTNAASNKRGE